MRRHLLPFLALTLLVIGVSLVLYPTAASWVSQYRQSLITSELVEVGEQAVPEAKIQLEQAYKYNAALQSGAQLEANERKATGSEKLDVTSRFTDIWPYEKQLFPDGRGVMARLRVPAADIDIPVYHGTDDHTLLRGAGHLRGTSLPVGGVGTRTVITAHRGLAAAKMFTDLDRVDIGDRFTFEVFGEVLTYEVRSTQVIEPEDTETLNPDPHADLATLITCTPLGINSHRIVVTGERVTPTPVKDVLSAGAKSELPRFPWWLVIWASVLVLYVGYLLHVMWTELRPHRQHRRPAHIAK
ncbi:MAG: class C sortase [Actinomycetaceae bacterium]|nr:class C sortase [Actinomycetaceae bacterium]